MNNNTSDHDSLIVIDDFYRDPMAVRQAALEKEFHDPPGKSARLAKTAVCSEQESRDLFALLRPHIPEQDIERLTVLFRYTLADTLKKSFCHIDNSYYAAIIYLTLPEHCAGGTTLYRHKLTGDLTYNPFNKHWYNYFDPSQWEAVKEIDMVFNRLVMYPGKLFHSLTPVFFGTDVSNARLTQNVFIYRPDNKDLTD